LEEWWLKIFISFTFLTLNLIPNKSFHRRLGFVVVHKKINHTPKATPNPIHGVFIDKAAKKPIVAMMQVIKNQITFFIINQIYNFKILQRIT